MVGIKLMIEVLEHAPAALTPRERWALVVLAEDASDRERVCSKGVESNEKVMRRFRAGRSERSAIIKALIEKGAIARVKRGQKHQHAEFKILPLAPSQQPENPDAGKGLCVRETRTQSHSQGPGSARSGSGKFGLSVRETRTPSPQSPQDPSSPRARAVQIVTGATGATEEEAEEVIKFIESQHTIRSLAGFLRTLADRGDLDAPLAAIRRRNVRANIGAWLEWLKTQPECEHGLPGGDQRRPDTGRPQCPPCRIRSGPPEGGEGPPPTGGRRPVDARITDIENLFP
jgi:hypothetical protein